MKIFLNGVSHLSGLNAFEYRDMMKACVVVFKGAAMLHNMMFYHVR